MTTKLLIDGPVLAAATLVVLAALNLVRSWIVQLAEWQTSDGDSVIGLVFCLVLLGYFLFFGFEHLSALRDWLLGSV